MATRETAAPRQSPRQTPRQPQTNTDQTLPPLSSSFLFLPARRGWSAFEVIVGRTARGSSSRPFLVSSSPPSFLFPRLPFVSFLFRAMAALIYVAWRSRCGEGGGARGRTRRVTVRDAVQPPGPGNCPRVESAQHRPSFTLRPNMSAAELEVENSLLKQRVHQLETELASVRAAAVEPDRQKWALDLDEYRRYGRQMIMPEIGLEGAVRLLILLVDRQLTRTPCRPASSQARQGPRRGCRRPRVSRRCISCRRRRRHNRAGRPRRCRSVKSAPADPALDCNGRDSQGRISTSLPAPVHSPTLSPLPFTTNQAPDSTHIPPTSPTTSLSLPPTRRPSSKTTTSSSTAQTTPPSAT